MNIINNNKVSSLLCSAFCISSASATSLIFDDFSSSSVGTQSRFRSDQANTGWSSFSSSLWDVIGGQLSNAGTEAGIPAEGAVGQIITTTSTANIIEISFDYNVGAGSTLFFHAQGLTENGAPGVNEVIGNPGAQNGSIQNSSETDYADLNLLDGSDTNGSGAAAASLTGIGTFTASIDVSTYSHAMDEAPGLTGAISDLSDFDLLLFAFGSNVTNNDGTGAISIDNFSVTAIPEPSSSMLLGVAGVALLLRRRR